MGKTRPPERSKLEKRKKKLVSEKKRKNAPPTPKELLAQAVVYLQQSDLEEALELANSALKQLKDSIVADEDVVDCLLALNLLGEINVELGELETAREYFKQAVEIDEDGDIPEEQGGGSDKFLWLAQLSEEGGKDSINWYEKAVEILRTRLDDLIDDASAKNHAAEIEMKKDKLSNTLCAMTEVYMTDLSWEDDAEKLCDEYTEEALSVTPNNAETLQTVASVRISQSKPDEARKFLRRSLDIWKDLPPENIQVPEYPVRISLARLLLEVNLYDEAFSVVERLVLEDDHSVEAWYLGGWCLHLQSENATANGVNGSKQQHDTVQLKRARGWLLQCLKLYTALEYEDEKLHEHAEELVETLNEILGPPTEEDLAEAGADGEWESADEDDDDEEEDEDDTMQD
jgi:tetratricopeptide (TPR) repeat protein